MSAAGGMTRGEPAVSPAAPERELSPAVVERVIAQLGGYCGLSFGGHNRSDLVRALRSALARFEMRTETDLVDLLDRPEERPEAVDWLVRTLTVGETYFFRIPEHFAFLREKVVPELVRERSRSPLKMVRAWSAGCASGEEAYSLAMALTEALPGPDPWAVSVLGTDINPEFLQRASLGRYSEWSLRGVAAADRERWFTVKPGGPFEVRDEIRRLARFKPLNLRQLGFPDPSSGTLALDVIFCRNVFIYFEPEIAAEVAARFATSLTEGGYVFFGASDPLPRKIRGLELVSGSVPVVYRRCTTPPAVSAGHPRHERAASPRCAAPIPQELSLSEISRKAKQHLDRGEGAQAGRWANVWLSREPESPEALWILAMARAADSRIEDAIASLRRALYFDPSFVLANFRLAELLAEKGHEAEARGCLSNALSHLARMDDSAIVAGSREVTAGWLRRVVEGRLSGGGHR